jgi:hypothetical protein
MGLNVLDQSVWQQMGGVSADDCTSSLESFHHTALGQLELARSGESLTAIRFHRGLADGRF